jgi:hypothetical protein
MVVAYVKNIPEHLEAEMETRSSSTLTFVQQFLENCTFTEPGGSFKGRRQLQEEENDEAEEQETSEEPALVADTRARDLFGGCPNFCSSSGSFRCKQMGCANCGRCGRRRERDLHAALERELSSSSSDSEDSSSDSEDSAAIMKTTGRTPSKRPTKRPTKNPTKRPTKAPTRRPSRSPTPPTVRPIVQPTARPMSTPTSKPTNAFDSVVDLLAEDVDEDFEDFLKAPGMTAKMIESRLDRHANFYYCQMQNLPNCLISYKILQVLSNGTTYALTGYPQ